MQLSYLGFIIIIIYFKKICIFYITKLLIKSIYKTNIENNNYDHHKSTLKIEPLDFSVMYRKLSLPLHYNHQKNFFFNYLN